MAGFSPAPGTWGPYESGTREISFSAHQNGPAGRRAAPQFPQAILPLRWLASHRLRRAARQAHRLPRSSAPSLAAAAPDTSSGNRASKVRRKDRALPLKPENGSVDIRFSEENTDIIRKIARRKIIRPIDYDVIGFDNLTSVLAAKHGVVQDDARWDWCL